MAQRINNCTDVMLALALRESSGLSIDSTDAMTSAIGNAITSWYRTYTIYSLHCYRDTGLCVSYFDGKAYSL